jgi:hypothetical protein
MIPFHGFIFHSELFAEFRSIVLARTMKLRRIEKPLLRLAQMRSAWRWLVPVEQSTISMLRSVLVGINERHVVKFLHWKTLAHVHPRSIQGIARLRFSGRRGEEK